MPGETFPCMSSRSHALMLYCPHAFMPSCFHDFMLYCPYAFSVASSFKPCLRVAWRARKLTPREGRGGKPGGHVTNRCSENFRRISDFSRFVSSEFFAPQREIGNCDFKRKKLKFFNVPRFVSLRSLLTVISVVRIFISSIYYLDLEICEKFTIFAISSQISQQMCTNCIAIKMRIPFASFEPPNDFPPDDRFRRLSTGFLPLAA